MKKKYPDDARLPKLDMHRLVIRFQQNESVEDSHQKNSDGQRSRGLDNIKSQNGLCIKHLM